jgi:hypothetical protein
VMGALENENHWVWRSIVQWNFAFKGFSFWHG